MEMQNKPRQDFFLFLLGGALFAAGIFLFCSQVMVGSGFTGSVWGSRSYGYRGSSLFGGVLSFPFQGGFGLLMVPFGTGVALLLAETHRRLAWFLIWASAAALGVGILQSLVFSFRPASLWSLLCMVFMIGAGAGLMFRSLRNYADETTSPSMQSSRESRERLQSLQEEIDRLKQRLDGP